MEWSTAVEDAKNSTGHSFPTNNVINDHVTLNLVDICLDNKLQILLGDLATVIETKENAV